MGAWSKWTLSLAGTSQESWKAEQQVACLGRWGQHMLLTMRGTSETTLFNYGWSSHKRPGTCSETPRRRGHLGVTFSSRLLNTALGSRGDDTQLHFFFFHACFASFFQEAFLCPTAWQVRTDLLVPFTRDRGRDKRKKILEPMTFLNLQLFLLFQTFPSPISPYRPQCHLRRSD